MGIILLMGNVDVPIVDSQNCLRAGSLIVTVVCHVLIVFIVMDSPIDKLLLFVGGVRSPLLYGGRLHLWESATTDVTACAPLYFCPICVLWACRAGADRMIEYCCRWT